jgi:hypothetical protein
MSFSCPFSSLILYSDSITVLTPQFEVRLKKEGFFLPEHVCTPLSYLDTLLLLFLSHLLLLILLLLLV